MTAHVDEQAEQAVVGLSLIGGDKIADTVLATGLRPHHFYGGRESRVFAAIMAVSERGVPVDPLTVRAEYERLYGKKDAKAVIDVASTYGGWSEHSPVYAQRVREMASMRDAQQALHEMQEALNKSDRAAVGRALEKLNRAGEETRNDSLTPEGWADEVFKYLHAPKEEGFVPMPFPSLTHAMGGGMQRGEVLLISGYTNHGKDLALDTLLPTPNGWRYMAEIEPGDFVFDETGAPTKVVAESGVLHPGECFKLTFSDGSSVVASGTHEWVTCTHESRASASRAQRRERSHPGRDQRSKCVSDGIATTKEIARTLRTSWGRLRHGVWAAGPLQYPEADLPVDPYVVGAWLGDGSARSGQFTCWDDEIVNQIRLAGYEVRPYVRRGHYGIIGLAPSLRGLGVLGAKHIPESYLRASAGQRLALLQGLMDTDGTVRIGNGGSRCEIALMNKVLAEGVYELCLGLGLLARWREDRATLDGEDKGAVYSIAFTTDVPVFRLSRKLTRLPKRQKVRHRTIVSVERVDPVPTKCIQVEAESHQYLVTKACIATHNSIVADQMLDMAAQHGLRAHLYMTEMTAAQRGLRLLSRRTGISFGRLRSRAVNEQEMDRIIKELGQMPYGVSVVSDWDIEDVVRDALRARFDLVVIDLIHGFRYDDERGLDTLSKAAQRLARISTTKEGWGGCAVVIVAHLSGGQMAGSKSNKRPQPGLHSLKGSTSLSQDPDFVLFVWQQDDENGLPTGEGKVWIPKARSGDNEVVMVRLNPRYLRFEVAADL